MSQVVQMDRGPGFAGSFGQGLSQGLNFMVQDMMQKKMNDRENSSLLKAMGRDDLIPRVQGSGISPQSLMSVLQLEQKYGASQKYNQLANKFGSIGQNLGPQSQPMLQDAMQGQMQGQMQMPQANTLQPGQGMMLPQEQMPAMQEPMMAPAQQPPMPEPQQNMQQLKPAQKLAELDRMFREEYPNIQGETPRKQAMQLYKETRNAIIQEGNLAARTKSADIAEKVAQKQLQELPKQVGDKLGKLEDIATRADQSINAVENIDSLLAQGAQMPKIIQDINLKLGTENPLSRFASNLAASDLSKAVETARVQQFTGMKDIFGGQIRIAEFNEFIKKLQDVKDPEVSNKLKSVLLKQFANMEKFPYEGLSRAVEENRDAPSDVILRKGKKYSDEMIKKYTTQSKGEMDRIIQENKSMEAAEKGYVRMISPDGTPGKVRKEDLKQAMKKGYKKQ